jgi:hypothetical protein
VSSPAPLARKLDIKPGRPAVVFNAPDGAIDALDPLPDGASVTDEAGETPADVVAVFVRDSAEVETWVAKAAGAVAPNGLLWVVYPKGRPAGTDINRNILRERSKSAG